jgi:transmembrane sensor
MIEDLSELEKEASAWLSRRVRGFSARDRLDFARWLQTDPRHAASFAAIAATWDQIGRLGETESASEFQAEVDDLIASEKRSRAIRRVSWSLTATAAAVAAVLYFGIGHSVTPADTFNASYATGASETRMIELPDGSHIRLSGETGIAVRFTQAERHIDLIKGEGRFSVAKNPHWAFTVQADGLDVTAVGTAFNVTLQSANVEVLVTEGKVSIGRDTSRGRTAAATHSQSASGPTLTPDVGFLRAGEKLTVPRQLIADASASLAQLTQIRTTLSEPVGQSPSSPGQRLVFEATSLSDIIAEFNQHNPKKLVIDDPELQQRRFSGIFLADQPQKFVALLAESYRVQITERDGEVHIGVPK